jgi:hypothetical protein
MVDKAQRDATLDQLKTTFDEWIQKRINREEAQAKFLKDMLEARGATERIQNDVVNKLTAVGNTDLGKLLSG